MIKKEIPVPGVGVFVLCPGKDNINVMLTHPVHGDYLMTPIVVEWGDIEDMDIIYEKFKDLQMKAFKPVAEALGVMYSNRTLYEALNE